MTREKTPSIVLVNPNNPGNYVQGMIRREHLGLCYLTTESRAQGFSTEIVDSRLNDQNPKDAADEILSNDPFMIGFSAITKDAVNWCQQVANIVKNEKENTFITLGNYFPTLQPQRALTNMPDADCIVLAEGDITFQELSKKVSNNQEWRDIDGLAFRTETGIHVSRRPLLTDLNKLPYPDHYGPSIGLQELPIMGSSGCYMRCPYCSISPFFDTKGVQKWRSRSSESIVSEIEQNLRNYPHIDRFRFVDPDFIGAQKHEVRLKAFTAGLGSLSREIEYIIDARTKEIVHLPISTLTEMRDSGLVEVYLGVENADPYIKRKMRKGTVFKEDVEAVSRLETLGVRVRFGYMMITPWTTEADIERNAYAMRSIGFPRPEKYFQEMFLVPGTDAVEMVRENMDIRWDNDGEGEYYTYELPPVINNLKKMGRSAVVTQIDFLSRFQMMHEQIRSAEEQNGSQQIETFKQRLNDLSLKFFLDIYAASKKLRTNVNDDTIQATVAEVVEDYLPKLNEIELDYKT